MKHTVYFQTRYGKDDVICNIAPNNQDENFCADIIGMSMSTRLCLGYADH